MGELSVDVRDDGDVVRVGLTGSLDLEAYEHIRVGLVDRLRTDGRDMVVDLTAVDYVDSTGLRLLVELAALASRDRRRCIVAIGDAHPARRVFAITRTDELLELVVDVDAAEASLSHSR